MKASKRIETTREAMKYIEHISYRQGKTRGLAMGIFIGSMSILIIEVIIKALID
jgi:hypothetical protein